LKSFISRSAVSRSTARESVRGDFTTVTSKYFVSFSAPLLMVAVSVTIRSPEINEGLFTAAFPPEIDTAELSLSHVIDVPLVPDTGTEKFCVILFSSSSEPY